VLAAAKELVEAVFKEYLLTQDASSISTRLASRGPWDKVRDKLVGAPDIGPGLGSRPEPVNLNEAPSGGFY
jgi:hypothetical protein